MEIPEIHMIAGFSDGVKLMQSPVPTSYLFFLFGEFQRWWKLGALMVAVYAAFRSVATRRKLVLILHRSFKKFPHPNDEAVDSGDDDGDAVSVDDFSSEDEQEPVVRETGTTSFAGGDFDVKGSQLFRGGWKPEFNLGRNVVQLWDSLGMSLDLDEDLLDLDSRGVVSTWDSDEEQKAIDYWSIPPISPATSPLILTAEGNEKGDGVILSGYDSRIRRRSPALYAEWKLPTRTVAGLSSGGVSKVYLRDDVNGVIDVGDVRKVGQPLKTVRESNGDRWWDADAVKFDD